MKSIKVQLTKEDIQEGVANNCRSCPIALRLRKMFDVRISVSSCTVRFEDPTSSIYASITLQTIVLPLAATEFIRTFDTLPTYQSREIQPISFNIEVTEEFAEKYLRKEYQE